MGYDETKEIVKFHLPGREFILFLKESNVDDAKKLLTVFKDAQEERQRHIERQRHMHGWVLTSFSPIETERNIAMINEALASLSTGRRRGLFKTPFEELQQMLSYSICPTHY